MTTIIERLRRAAEAFVDALGDTNKRRTRSYQVWCSEFGSADEAVPVKADSPRNAAIKWAYTEATDLGYDIEDGDYLQVTVRDAHGDGAVFNVGNASDPSYYVLPLGPE